MDDGGFEEKNDDDDEEGCGCSSQTGTSAGVRHLVGPRAIRVVVNGSIQVA